VGLKEKLKHVSFAIIGMLAFISILLAGGFFLKGGTWVFEKFYPIIITINSVVFGLTLLLLLLSLMPKLRSFTGTAIYIGSWVLGATFWLFCLHTTYVLWGLVAAIIGVMTLGVGVFGIAALALLFHGYFLQLTMLLLTLGVIYALRTLGIWFVESREEGSEIGSKKIIPIVAFVIIGIFIVMSVGFNGASTNNSNQTANQSRQNPFESLNSYELDKISSVMTVSQEKPLVDSDLNNLRTALKSYADRTGHYLTKSDVETFVRLMNMANDYQYELGQSLLFSWDSHRPYSTKRFDKLCKEMQQDGSRKPELLQSDKNRIKEAANNQSYTEDATGNRYEFSRELILENINKQAIAKKNCEIIVKVYNEFVK
jgi:hypothetical protein